MNKTNDFKYNLPAYSDPVDIEDLNDNFRGIDDALMAGLCKKDYTGNNMGSSDPSARKYAWAPWLEIVNDNEFDVVVTDRNAPVGSEEATINIAAGQTFRKYINGRYYMNFYVQDQHDVTFKWFVNAETYINESGGGGGGTGTVTSVSVQGGSGSHLTGSGNPIETSGTITINVDEGYSIPSDNEQTAWDGKAADLKFEINSSTFVITAQLKDSSGNLIGNERTIDLPLESVVVSGTYDDQTKKVILTLQNGSTIEFSVADLVSGLQTELSASNKLDPAYIDYDSSHRAVSDTEKDTWSGKQNAISDLETIRSGATAGATAVQPSAMQTALAGKQDSLDQTQLAAVNSGIDSTKVAQISTNQSNILYALKNGAKNFVNLFDIISSRSCTATELENGGMRLACTNAVWAQYFVNINLKPNTQYVLYTNMSNFSGTSIGAISIRVQYKDEHGNLVQYKPTQTGEHTSTFTTESTTDLKLSVLINDSDTARTQSIDIWVMICEKVIYDTDPSYVSASLPNYDLTRLEAEDRASLAEEIDAGAKNQLDFANLTYQTNTGVTFNKTNTEITVTSSNTKWGYVCYKCSLPAGSYVFSCKISNLVVASGTRAAILLDTNTTAQGTRIATQDVSDGTVSFPFTWTGGTFYIFYYPGYTNVTNSNSFTASENMICTKAAFGVSQKFVPYRMSYQDLCDKKDAALSTTSKTSGSLDDIAENSFYFVSDGTTGRPVSEYGFVKTSVYSSSVMLQEFTSFSGNAANSGLVFVRVKQAGTWQSWKQLTNA